MSKSTTPMRTVLPLLFCLLVVLVSTGCSNSASIPDSIKDSHIKYKCPKGVCETVTTTYDLFNVMAADSKKKGDGEIEIKKGRAGKLDIIMKNEKGNTVISMDNNYVINKISFKIPGTDVANTITDPKQITSFLGVFGARPDAEERAKEAQENEDTYTKLQKAWEKHANDK